MLSLKDYLNRNETQTVPRSAVNLLVEKIGAAAIVVDPEEYDAFKADLAAILARVGPEVSIETLMLTIGSAGQALETYNKRIAGIFDGRTRKLQNAINMITETVVQLGDQKSLAVQRLHEIGDAFERAGTFTDLDTLRAHLNDCLLNFRQETIRQREESESLIAGLRAQIERGNLLAKRSGAENLDPATGLPGKEMCLDALRQPSTGGGCRYVVTMVVSRIASVNARFGYAAGNRILRTFAEFIEKQLPPSDKLFRWNGPAIVAVLEKSEPLDRVRVEVKRILETRLEDNLELAERSVLIPISATWSIFQFIAGVPAAEKQIQAFIASQGNPEFA
jgi:GGDEF domain-containing protein